ncbi:MAG: hypothetical protein OHK0013_11110 [Sandaracinaceae bacterium]
MDLQGLLRELVRALLEAVGFASDAASSRAIVIADILALAALADGQVTREELRLLQATEIGEGDLAVVVAERLYALDLPAEEVQSPEWLEVQVSDLALRLSREERAQAMRYVLLLARRGSRLKERELPGGRIVGLDPRELVELFARALAIAPEELEALYASLLET